MPQYRFCGRDRKPGAVYHSTTPEEFTSGAGDSLFFFLYCPPKGPLYQEQLSAMRLAHVGVSMWEDETGTWHVVDIIGRAHYKYWPDWVEESRVLGVSRLFQSNIRFDLLIPDVSTHILIHPAGWLHNHGEYLKERVHLFDCPRPDLDNDHTKWDIPADDLVLPRYMCQSLLWQAVDEHPNPKGNVKSRRFERPMPNGNSYHCAQSPEGVTPQFGHALMGQIPITRFEIPNDDVDGSHQITMDKLDTLGCNIPYMVTED